MQRLVSLFCVLLCCWLVSADLTLEVLDATLANQVGARCLDGSPGSYHFELGNLFTDIHRDWNLTSPGAETKKWVIYMEGGGSCDTKKSCTDRSLTNLGSSLNQTQILITDSVASNDPVINPGFWNWTHVRLDYCSGDRWGGTRVNASAASWGFYFAGHVIFKTILDHLISKYRLDQATEILFHGGSAGAYGAMTNIDVMNQKLPGPKISLAMNSGWGIDFYPAWSGLGVDGEVNVSSYLYLPHINQDCAAANPTNLTYCLFPRYVFSYIPNRVYIINSLLDKVQLATLGFPDAAINNAGGGDYLIQVGNYLKLSILAEYTRDAKVDGLFITSCPYHGIDFAVQGVLPNVAEATWYYRPKTSPTPAVNYDNCALDSVVALLKANNTLSLDCPRLMQLCTKNANSNAFEAAFAAAPLDAGSDAPSDVPTTTVVSAPTNGNAVASTANSVSYLTVMAVIMVAVASL